MTIFKTALFFTTKRTQIQNGEAEFTQVAKATTTLDKRVIETLACPIQSRKKKTKGNFCTLKLLLESPFFSEAPPPPHYFIESERLIFFKTLIH